jgi:hypothetical protein
LIVWRETLSASASSAWDIERDIRSSRTSFFISM